MPLVTWADHLTIARAVASIGDYDLGEGFALMACGLHLLQCDLIWSVFDDDIALSSALVQGKNNSLSVVDR